MNEFLKRAFDLILSFAFLLITLPFTLAIALAIKSGYTRAGLISGGAGWKEWDRVRDPEIPDHG